jgi:hypothetical protein
VKRPIVPEVKVGTPRAPACGQCHVFGAASGARVSPLNPTTKEDITMFMQRLGRDSQARRRGTGPLTRVRRRNHQLNCEALDSRQLLSAYYIASVSSGKVVDDPGGSTSENTFIDQYQLTGTANQQWNFISQGNGYYEIANAQSGQALTDYDNQTGDGAKVVQWPWNGQPQQLWKLVEEGNGSGVAEAFFNMYTGLALGDPGFSSNNSTGLIQWHWTGGTNEEWQTVGAGSPLTTANYVTNLASGLTLDDPGGTSNVTNIDQYQLTGGYDQRWLFVQTADGYDLIVNQASGMVLTDTNFSTTEGVDIQQDQIDNSSNQEWQVNQQSDGYFQLVNQYSKQVLDDPNSATSDYTPVDQWPWNDGSNQQWVIVEAGSGPARNFIDSNFISDLPLYDPEVGNGGYVMQAYPGGNSTNVQ